MAGEWLKMESATPDKPEVLAITAKMGWDDPDLTVGKLFRLWRWFDQQTTDGNARGVTSALLDRQVGASGFVQALADVGWATISTEGVELKNFERHNGKTAKERALTAKRVANHKNNGGGNADGNGDANAHTVSGALPRKEKKREEKNTPLPPAGGCKRFEEFWTAWPKSDRKQDKVKCADKWRRGGLDDLAEAILSDLERRKGGRKWREADGQYIEAPLTYLNGKRWEDGATEADELAQETFV